MTRLINLAQIGCFVLFSLAIISGCATSPAPLTDTSATDVVVKSPNDQRDYAHVTLDNGMRVLLISDPDADKSAAALVAFRGSFHDPEDRPGLAHFLEHMLFIGTEKYPEPDGYFAFVQKHKKARERPQKRVCGALDHTVRERLFVRSFFVKRPLRLCGSEPLHGHLDANMFVDTKVRW